MNGARAVLVTGASGLVGRQVVALLAEGPADDRKTVAFDLRPPPSDARRDGVAYVEGDIRDPELAKCFEAHHVDVVVHLAAVVTPGPETSNDLEYSIDVLGTDNVLAACLRARVRQLVYTSSGAAYGYHADNPVPLREDDPLRGNEDFPYARHKRLAEELLGEARVEHPELAQLVFRPGTILGASVASPISALFERRVVVGVVGSEAPFVLIWDEDVARAIVQGIRERRSGIYNLCGDGAIALREIARRLGRPYLPVPAPVLKAGLRLARASGLSERGPEQVDFLRYRPVLSNEKLRTEFGLTPATSEECFERYRSLRFGSRP